MGLFLYHVDKILHITDPPCWHFWRNCFTIIGENLDTVNIVNVVYERLLYREKVRFTSTVKRLHNSSLQMNFQFGTSYINNTYLRQSDTWDHEETIVFDKADRYFLFMAYLVWTTFRWLLQRWHFCVFLKQSSLMIGVSLSNRKILDQSFFSLL